MGGGGVPGGGWQHLDVAVIEITTFRTEGAEAAFLAADRRVQEDFAYQRVGLLRRTLARGAGDQWAVVQLWWTAENADAAVSDGEHDEAVQAFRSHVVEGTWEVQRFTTLE